MTGDSPCAADFYKKLIVERDCFVEEAHRSALVTIPAVMPNTDDVLTLNDPEVLAKPFQSLGARGVNNLASAITLALFPPTVPFLKYEATAQAIAEIKAAGIDMAQIEAALNQRVSLIQDLVDVSNLRTKVYQMVRHLLVAGNVMMFFDKKAAEWQLFPLTHYVCKRDGRGNLVELIYVERLDRRTITDSRVRDMLDNAPDPQNVSKIGDRTQENVVHLYTHVTRVSPKTFEKYQEVNGEKVPGTTQRFPANKLPWLVLRYTALDGEDYGRGYAEEYRGDLSTFEHISRDMTFASANAAKVIWGINPNSPVKPQKFDAVENGGSISAQEGDIHAIRLDKGGDMSVVFQFLSNLERALSADFLLNASFQRNQERVTAEEVRLMAQELDDRLGGVFSQLTQDIQIPVARLLEAQIPTKDFPALPEAAAKISVVTGLSAIGRGHELQTLRQFGAEVANIAQVKPGVVDHLDERGWLQRAANGTGVDTQGLVLDQQVVDANRQAAQQAAAQQTLGQEGARGLGNAIGSGNIDPSQIPQISPQE